MGALTSKNFPFELREWDVEYFKSIDPTDSFGSNTRVYIKENQIIQIEPDYNVFTHDLWITDKGRQFFDSFLNNLNEKNQKKWLLSWPLLLKKIILTLYFFDFFNVIQKKSKKFIIIFENISLEILSFLAVLQNNFSFLKLKKIEKHNILNDFESNFQLNLSANKTKLKESTFCFIVANNPRYEGYYLNLYLKKRFAKGNFECFVLGSITNLTFFTSFLGSSLKTFTNIVDGKHLICQKLKSARKPCLILNTDFFKRPDSNVYCNILQILQYSGLLSFYWNGVNILNYSLNDNGINATLKFSTFKIKDFFTFSALYFLNVGVNNLSTLKRLIKNILLKHRKSEINIFEKPSKFLILDQSELYCDKSELFKQFFHNVNIKKKYPWWDYRNYLVRHFYDTQKVSLENYFYIQNNIFYENEDTFINTRGFYCKTTKLILKKKTLLQHSVEKTKNIWQILREIVHTINKKIKFLDVKSNNSLFPDLKSLNYLKIYINFHFYASIGLTSLNYYLNKQTKPFIFLNFKFNNKKIKNYNTKLHYWLDNFFIGSKDEYSFNSKILNFCSNFLKEESSLFF